MKRINLNGKELYICTKQQALDKGWPIYFEWRNGLVTVTYLNKGDCLELVGLGGAGIDTELPQNFYDDLLHKGLEPWHYVWTYNNPGARTFGEAVNWYYMLKEMASLVQALVLDGERAEDE